MNRLKNIVLGVDFSGSSRSALEQAVRMAQWNGARLRIVHVIEHLTISERAEACGYSPEEIEQEVRHQATEKLRLWQASVPKDVAVESEVILGNPLGCLLAQMKAQSADLLVLGVNGASLVAFGAGTLATKCLRKSPAKVMLVDEKHARPFQVVVCGVDFSEAGRDAIEQALRVADQDGSEIHFVNVVPAEPRWYELAGTAAALAGDLKPEQRRAVETKLRDFVGDVRGHKTRFVAIEGRNAARGLSDYSREILADLILVSRKGRSDLSYVLLGSTVERLLRELPASVLLVPSSTAAPAASGQ
jgi:nucleotide-binding universal stress UspA family protein